VRVWVCLREEDEEHLSSHMSIYINKDCFLMGYHFISVIVLPSILFFSSNLSSPPFILLHVSFISFMRFVNVSLVFDQVVSP